MSYSLLNRLVSLETLHVAYMTVLKIQIAFAAVVADLNEHLKKVQSLKEFFAVIWSLFEIVHSDAFRLEIHFFHDLASSYFDKFLEDWEVVIFFSYFVRKSNLDFIVHTHFKVCKTIEWSDAYCYFNNFDSHFLHLNSYRHIWIVFRETSFPILPSYSSKSQEPFFQWPAQPIPYQWLSPQGL